ncbi:MAG TPA: hypothetical protein VMV43_04150 [Candidatus Nanopelagicaceae bacterium]|nr:hypothetical protein [Candidatus Nanopelagicaceae bacterium]
MKLNRLKSIVNDIVRTSISSQNGRYLLDPFEHYTPEVKIIIDLKSKTFTPDLDGDAVETYYSAICDWFYEVLPKEGIPIDVIDSAILSITPHGKECIIKVNEREFKSFLSYR